MFERYNKFQNELSEYPRKKYPHRKFMPTLPHHMEHKISSIRKRPNFNIMSLEQSYGKLKTDKLK